MRSRSSILGACEVPLASEEWITCESRRQRDREQAQRERDTALAELATTPFAELPSERPPVAPGGNAGVRNSEEVHRE